METEKQLSHAEICRITLEKHGGYVERYAHLFRKTMHYKRITELAIEDGILFDYGQTPAESLRRTMMQHPEIFYMHARNGEQFGYYSLTQSRIAFI